MVNSIIGAGVFGLPSVLAAQLGGLSPWSCVLAGAGILVIAACIAEVSSQFEETGGLYLYARAAFGPFPSLIVAWLTWLTRIAAPAAAADLFATYAGQFLPVLRGRSAEVLVMALLIAHLAALNYLGVRTGKNLSNVFTGVKVVFLLFFIFSAAFMLWTHPALRVPLSFPHTTAANWFEAILLLVYAYGGFEGALFVGGETKNPKRDTPIALLLALVIVCAIYTAVQWTVIAALPAAGSSVRPLADAAQRLLGPAGAAAIGLAALVSTYGYLSANMLHGPRIAFALAEQGDFPRMLSRVHARFRTPHVSILLYALLLFAFSALGDFRWNAMLSAVARLVVYGAMALAVPVLRRKNRGAAQFRLPAHYLFAAAGVFLAALLLVQMHRGEAIIVGGTAAIAAVNWAFVRRP